MPVSVPQLCSLSCEMFHSKSAHSRSKLPILYIRTAEQLCTKLHDANLFKLTIKHLKGTVCKEVYIKKKKKEKKKSSFLTFIIIIIIIYYYIM